jgi:carbonic anhydrase
MDTNLTNTDLTGKWTRRRVMTGLAATGVIAGSGLRAVGQSSMSPDAAMHELAAGNERFIAGKISSFSEDVKILQEKTVLKQEPFAAILSCADSRVPVEIIFDQTIGHLFVTRVAGNLVTPEIIASLEYGVAVLGVKAILVMGHSNCGAISAAMAAKEVPGQISALYQHLIPGIAGAKGDASLAVKLNAAYQAQVLRSSSTIIAKAIKNDALKVAGGVYDLGSGKVTLTD